MTREHLDALIADHADHAIAETMRRLHDLYRHEQGWRMNLMQRDHDAAALLVKIDQLEARVWGLEQELEAARGQVPMPWLPQTAEELTLFLREAGATVFMDGDTPKVRVPPGAIEADVMHRLRPMLKEHREAILAALDHTADRKCEECGAQHPPEASSDDIFDLCRRVLCPHWRRGHPASDQGFERQRSYALWKKGRDAELAAQQEVPIPD